MTHNPLRTHTFKCNSAVSKNQRVALAAGTDEIETAGATAGIGFALRAGAAGEMVAVSLHGAIFEAIAAAALTPSTVVGFAASGKVNTDTDGPYVAISSTSADGDSILLVPLEGGVGIGAS